MKTLQRRIFLGNKNSLSFFSLIAFVFLLVLLYFLGTTTGHEHCHREIAVEDC